MGESEIYADLKREFQDSVPSSIREVVIKLLKHPLWLEICKVLYRTPISEHMTQAKLIESMRDFIEESHIDYLQLNDSLEVLNKKGYIHLEETSMPDHFLTPKTVEAIEVINVIENQIVLPLVRELRRKGFKDPDTEKRVRKDVYSNLK